MLSSFKWCMIYASLLSLCCLFDAPIVLADDNSEHVLSDEYLTNIELNDRLRRYVLHLDYYGTPLIKGSVRDIEKQLRIGDEIQIRYYPTRLFSVEHLSLPDSLKDKLAFVVFPLSVADTFSIAHGYGSVTIAHRLGGEPRLAIRVVDIPSLRNVGEPVAVDSIYTDLTPLQQRESPAITDELHGRGFSKDWRVSRCDLTLQPGVHVFEVYQIAGTLARLLCRSSTVVVGEYPAQVNLRHKVDAQAPGTSSMVRSLDQAYFDAIIGVEQPGVYELGLEALSPADAWTTRQSLFGSLEQSIPNVDIRLIVGSVQSRPGSLRARAGYAAFNRAREGRLISNLVFVLSPESYFSSKTPILKRLNPTTGLQIGGTGSKDIVFLMGLSFKLIDQADLVGGLRFGREENAPWLFKHNLYFGMTLDPGLLNRLRNQD